MGEKKIRDKKEIFISSEIIEKFIGKNRTEFARQTDRQTKLCQGRSSLREALIADEGRTSGIQGSLPR